MTLAEVVSALDKRGDTWIVSLQDGRALVIVEATNTHRGGPGVQSFDISAWSDAGAQDIARSLGLTKPEPTCPACGRPIDEGT
jgi:hypothetical protein